MPQDAKWYAGYMRIAYAESAEVKRVFLEAADLLENMPQGFVDARVDQPKSSDECVLAIVSGKPRKNITLDKAYCLANYSKDEGWIIDGFEEWETADVHCWMPLPALPTELKEEGL